MVLLAITVAVAYVDLGSPWNIIIAMTIAVVKATLVILYFMHVRYSSKLTWVFVGAGFVWFLILIILTFADYGSRSWIGPVN
jgi:cytochrome c oxidase subunit IV